MTASPAAGRFLESVYTAAYGAYDSQPYRRAILRRLRSLADCLTRPGVEVPRDVRDNKTATKWDHEPLAGRAQWVASSARRAAYDYGDKPDARGSRDRALAVPVPAELDRSLTLNAPAPALTVPRQPEGRVHVRHFVVDPYSGEYLPARAGRLVRLTGLRHRHTLAAVKRARALRPAEAAR